MTLLEESRLNMYLTVGKFLAKFLATFNVLPEFTKNYTALNTAIGQIQGQVAQTALNDTGVSESKVKLHDTLIELTIDTARKTHAYAKLNAIPILEKEMEITISDLRKKNPIQLISIAKGIHSKTQTNVAALATYQVTTATQTTLMTAITNFEATLGSSRSGTAEDNHTSSILDGYFADADKAIENIDTILDIIRLKQKDLYNSYTIARKLIKVTRSKVQVQGFVIDAETKDGIAKAKLQIKQIEDAEGNQPLKPIVLERKTAIKGGFNLSGLDKGIYEITVIVVGYATTINTFEVGAKKADLSIKITKTKKDKTIEVQLA